MCSAVPPSAGGRTCVRGRACPRSFGAEQPLQGQAVGIRPEAADNATASGSNHGHVAESLAGVHVADVHLHHGGGHGADGVLQGDGRVGIGARVEDDAVIIEAHPVDAVDELALDVGLEIIYLHLGMAAAQGGQAVVERRGAIDARLAAAQQIEVGAVDDLNLLHIILFLHYLCRAKVRKRYGICIKKRE